MTINNFTQNFIFGAFNANRYQAPSFQGGSEWNANDSFHSSCEEHHHHHCHPMISGLQDSFGGQNQCQSAYPDSSQAGQSGMMWVPFMGGDSAQPGQSVHQHQTTTDQGNGNIQQHTTFDTATGNQVKDMVSNYNRNSGETLTVETTAEGKHAYVRTRVVNGQTICDISGDDSVTHGIQRETINYNGTSYDVTDTMQDGSQRVTRSTNTTEQTAFRAFQPSSDGSYTMSSSPDGKIGTQTWAPGTSPTQISEVL